MENDKKTNKASWRKFFTGIAAIILIFAAAIGISSREQYFEIHTMAIEKNIDTSAFFYTDLEEFAVSEQWMFSTMDRENTKPVERASE